VGDLVNNLEKATNTNAAGFKGRGKTQCREYENQNTSSEYNQTKTSCRFNVCWFSKEKFDNFIP